MWTRRGPVRSGSYPAGTVAVSAEKLAIIGQLARMQSASEWNSWTRFVLDADQYSMVQREEECEMFGLLADPGVCSLTWSACDRSVDQVWGSELMPRWADRFGAAGLSPKKVTSCQHQAPASSTASTAWQIWHCNCAPGRVSRLLVLIDSTQQGISPRNRIWR